MQELIKLYLLQQPHSVSDMINDLTKKDLSDLPKKRHEEIPRIAGNWFREDTGYLWQLKNSNDIKDIGRQYAINRNKLVDDFLGWLNIYDCFPEHEERGRYASLNDAYSSIIQDYTLRRLKKELRETIFEGDLMAELFNFDTLKGTLLTKETRKNRLALYTPRIRFWPAVTFILLSSLIKTRKRQLRDRMEDKDQYFRWKNRLLRLNDTTQELIERIIHRINPAAEQDSEGTFTDPHLQQLADSFGTAGVHLDQDILEFIADIYLLSLRDGVELFRQYSKHDQDEHLLFNLLERGWIVESRTLETIPDTGNQLLPLSNIHSYLDTLSRLFTDTDS